MPREKIEPLSSRGSKKPPFPKHIWGRRVHTLEKQERDKMHKKNAEQFLRDLTEDQIIRKQCLAAAALPTEERRSAILALGYSFTPKELDDVVCREFPYMPKNKKEILGEGDLRDIIMKNWGNHMYM